MQLSWSLPQLIGYLNTWSSVQQFITTHHINPVTLIEAILQEKWGDNAVLKPIFWDIYLKVGKV